MKRQSLVFLFVVLLFFLTRLIKLMELPLFIDETSQLEFVRAFLANPFSPFVSLNHGVQPLFPWLLTLPVMFLPDPLLAGRLVAVCGGFAGLLGLWTIARFYSLSLGKWFAVLSFIFSPLLLLHDRLALRDSLLCASAIWLFYCLVRWFSTLSWNWMRLAAVMLGAAILNKHLALLFIPLVPLTFLFIRAKEMDWRRFFKQVLQFLLMGFCMHSILLLSSGYGNMIPHDGSFLLRWPAFFQNPFQLVPVNGPKLIEWLSIYAGWPVLLMGLLSPLLLWRRNKEVLSASLAWILFPLGIYLLVGVKIYPRYLIFTLPFWYLLAGFCLEEIYILFRNRFHAAARLAMGGMILLLLWSPFSLWRQIMFNLKEASLPPIDRWQLLEGWPAGYGFNEAVAFFKEYPRPCLIFTEEYNFLTTLGFPLYLKNTNCRVQKVDLWKEEIDWEELRSKYSGEDLFVALNKRQVVSHGGWLEEVAAYPKVGNKSFLKIYRFNENL